jgi:hypothetical protein
VKAKIAVLAGDESGEIVPEGSRCRLSGKSISTHLITSADIGQAIDKVGVPLPETLALVKQRMQFCWAPSVVLPGRLSSLRPERALLGIREALASTIYVRPRCIPTWWMPRR